MPFNWYEQLKHKIRFWLLARLPTCQETVQVISQSLERSLSIRERVLLKLHLWICMWCQWYLEHLLTIRTTLRSQAEKNPEMELPTTATLSAEARERIKRSLGAE